MTHPADMRPAEMLAMINAHAALALRLENATATQSMVVVRTAHNGVIRYAARTMAGTTPYDVQRAVSMIAVHVATTPPPNPVGVLLRGARRAARMGALQAARALGERVAVPVDVAAHTVGLAYDVAARIRQRWDDAYRMLVTRDITSLPDVVTALTPIGSSVNDTDASARWIANASLNQGLHDTAVRHGTELIWFAEPDACLTCLALAGETVGANDSFDPSLTFDRHPLPWWNPSNGVLRPPRHRRCRCRAEPYRPEDWDEKTAGMSLVALLKRDAERSVLRGWAGASEPRRVDAADRLLATGSVLPKHVQDIARHAVETGHFNRKETV